MVRLTDSSFVCECTHLTHFLSFFNKGAEVVQSSNYAVWLALPDITLSSLQANVGFYIVCTYWLLLLIFGVIAARTDRKRLKNDFFSILYKLTHTESASELDNTFESDASVYPIETFEGKTTFTKRSKSKY